METKVRYDEALDFAIKAHKGQKRRDRQFCCGVGAEDCDLCEGKGYWYEDYITHPIAVAAIAAELARGKMTDNEIETVKVAALLHDTVEDTAVTHADIITKFGQHIYLIVNDLTHVDTNSYSEQFINLLENGSISAKIIKLADMSHNLLSAEGCVSKHKIQLWKICVHVLQKELNNLLGKTKEL